MKKKHLLFILLNFFVCILYSQYSEYVSDGSSGAYTVTGTQIINKYYSITSITYNGIYQVYYDSSAGPSPAVGDRVMFIQMTGTDVGGWLCRNVIAAGNPFTLNLDNTSMGPFYWSQIRLKPRNFIAASLERCKFKDERRETSAQWAYYFSFDGSYSMGDKV
jgi:hypothetical protein